MNHQPYPEKDMHDFPPARCSDCGNTEEFDTKLRIRATVDGTWNLKPGTIHVLEILSESCLECDSRLIRRDEPGSGLCTECGKPIADHDDYDGDDGPICASCFSENYCACTLCESGFRWQFITHRNDNEWLCPGCVSGKP